MATAKVNGIDLAYELRGAGAPLVLAHGYTASKEMYDAQLGPFAERYRVLVYDSRGHGESEALPADDPGYHLDTYVEDQLALMRHVGIEQAYVGGLSMGGMIALRFALAHPELVRALLLCDTTAGMGTSGQWAANHAAIETLVRSKGVAAVMRNLYAQRAGGGDRPRPQQIPAGVLAHIERLDQMSADGFLGAGRAAAEQDSVLDRLGEIEAPTLIITGEQDFFRDDSERMKERLPEARFVVIKGAAHGTCVWRPEAFTATVLDFLADVEAGRNVAGREER
ncbi:MAG: alpha/beta fold hydrolase, partial [Chloroflexi bacterium]|nr:alpha/beta fold hydrolase [Chloroflexota bacterium]